MKRNLPLILVSLALLAALGWIGWHAFKMPAGKATSTSPKTSTSGVVQDNSGKTVRYWYDPMVPAQKFDKPGKSPFMDMMLEPKYAEGDGTADSADNGVAISSQTLQNLGVRLALVSMASFGEALSAVGRIEPDERRFYTVQPRIPGFVERLMVRAVGDPVKKGQKIAEIYAPELLAAQQEYLALLKLDGVPDVETLRQAARSRLKLLGMTEGEISAITQSRSATQRFGIYAPASGIITELGVREGGQLMAGASLVQIADLSSVWLMAEVPERDVARLKIGTPAEVELQSLPGETFKGKVNYLYPELAETTRTVRVRIELANKSGHLRTGMYGNVKLLSATHEALSVPSESVIATGTRKVAIVKQEHGFRPVEIETGQERDGRTEILNGLTAGEEVVASGQFLIDSEASLSGVLDKLKQAPGKAEMAPMQKKEMGMKEAKP